MGDIKLNYYDGLKLLESNKIGTDHPGVEVTVEGKTLTFSEFINFLKKGSEYVNTLLNLYRRKDNLKEKMEDFVTKFDRTGYFEIVAEYNEVVKTIKDLENQTI